jgi:hypothetical protein
LFYLIYIYVKYISKIRKFIKTLNYFFF